MSADAVAVLRITGLAPPRTPFGTDHPVEHRGGATLINLMQRFDGADPDEHALILRWLLGPALDAHDDPRGVLLFRDVRYPKATDYDSIVAEVCADGGVWAPMVAAGYIPERYCGRPRHPHDVLVGEMIAIIGRDAALGLDMSQQVDRILLASAPERLDAAEAYRARLGIITSAMGPAFIPCYEASLQDLIEAKGGAHVGAVSLDDLSIATDDPEPPQAGSHDAVVEEMAAVMGREAALQANMAAMMGTIAAPASPGLAGAADTLRAQLDAIRNAMGAQFAERFEASLARQADALRADVTRSLADERSAPPDGPKQD